MTSVSIRALAALALGATAALTVSACTGADPLTAAVADVRDQLPAAESNSVNDAQIIVMGRIVCGTNTTEAQIAAMEPGTREATRELLHHCEVWNGADLAALTGTPAAIPVPPTDGADMEGGDAALAAEEAAHAGEVDLSPRGAWPMTVGQTVDSYGPAGVGTVGQRVTVTGIAAVSTASCEGVSNDDQPVNGRFVAVSRTIENTADYLRGSDGSYLSKADWEFVGDDGRAYPRVDSLNAFYCAGDRAVQLPMQLGAGRTYTEVEFMDLPRSGGWLIATAPDGNAYEYRIPAA
jgi:hypothetical protein